MSKGLGKEDAQLTRFLSNLVKPNLQAFHLQDQPVQIFSTFVNRVEGDRIRFGPRISLEVVENVKETFDVGSLQRVGEISASSRRKVDGGNGIVQPSGFEWKLTMDFTAIDLSPFSLACATWIWSEGC